MFDVIMLAPNIVNIIEIMQSLVIAVENSDLYCYIMVILNYLYGSNLNTTVAIEEFYEYMNYLEYI